MPNISKLLFPAAVIAFSAYNTAVIEWELNKSNSTTCSKCARTRQAIGMLLMVASGWVIWNEVKP
jgi:hypothetical protein